MKTKNGQLAPLKDRINAYQQAKRGVRIQARRTVAEYLIRQNQQMAMAMNYMFNRTIWGRFKYLLTGR